MSRGLRRVAIPACLILTLVTACSSDTNVDEVVTEVAREQDNELTPQEVSAEDPAIFVSDIRPTQPDPEATRQYIDGAVAHLDRVWTAWFESTAIRWVGALTLSRVGSARCDS